MLFGAGSLVLVPGRHLARPHLHSGSQRRLAGMQFVDMFQGSLQARQAGGGGT